MTAAAVGRQHGRGHAQAGKVCHHLHEHKLTCAQYEELRDRAGGQCEICGVEETAVYRQLLHIDHDHETGLRRGLLCAKCNSVMACYDGQKRWGVNRVWEEQAALYVAMAKLWAAYSQATRAVDTDPFSDLLDHVRAVIADRGDDEARQDLAAAEEELTERRARKGR